MPVAPTYPGVYVQEVPSGVRTIVGVSTSVGMFIGASKKGPIGEPIRCLNYSAFRDRFGEDSSAGQLAQNIKLFFLNGGTDCYAMRLANGATAATLTLKNENKMDVLTLTAIDFGLAGESIRALVTYSGPQPEATFNLELFRWATDSVGRRSKSEGEQWRGLSMDPQSPLYAPAFLTQNSKLVSATPAPNLSADAPAGSGASISGRLMPDAEIVQTWKDYIDGTNGRPKAFKFQISVKGSPYALIDLTFLQTFNLTTELAGNLTTLINGKLPITSPATQVTVSFAPNAGFSRLQIQHEPGAPGDLGDVFIRPAASQDLAVPMMLGTAQGGIEISGRALQRPAPTGLAMKAFDPTAPLNLLPLNTLAGLDQAGPDSLTGLTLDVPQPDGTFVADIVDLVDPAGSIPGIRTVTGAGAKFFTDAYADSLTEHHDGVREKLNLIVRRVNAFQSSAGPWKWKADLWGYRLVLLPVGLDDNFIPNNFAIVAGGNSTAGMGLFIINVAAYSIGNSGDPSGFQTPAAAVASDGGPPQAGDYDTAYTIIDKEVDIFNLMILPMSEGPTAISVEKLYGNASVFCQQRRAFLLMDPPTDPANAWTDAQKATTEVPKLRVGLVKDYSAVFYPRITIDDNGLQKNIGPAGAIAGLCARIDGTRGVWKAPAGTEADLRGIVGLEERFSDGENGILNPRAINVLRIFPNGIVNWGARTNDGDDDNPSDYKYIPIRRLASFMEESLYRGLKWVVFEPNDEPLWAQIRLNVGAFMHDLFRQGAFQGTTPKDAYFVKCDGETTTQSDRNLGIVNIWVGFAPLKPAEFVILYLQQMAGQIQI
jgi:phage tail sheath protein FI